MAVPLPERSTAVPDQTKKFRPLVLAAHPNHFLDGRRFFWAQFNVFGRYCEQVQKNKTTKKTTWIPSIIRVRGQYAYLDDQFKVSFNTQSH